MLVNDVLISNFSIVTYTHLSMTASIHPVPLGVVENIVSFPYGPRNMFIAWDRLSENTLKGDEDNQLFFISLEPVMSGQTGEAQIDITEGLEPSTNYTFNVSLREHDFVSCTSTSVLDMTLPSYPLQWKVLINNGVFNSSISSIQTDSTWPLPPSPQLTSLTISVTTESLMAAMDLSLIHKDIHQLHLEVGLL